MAKKAVKKKVAKKDVVEKRSGAEYVSNEQAIITVMQMVNDTNARIDRIVKAISTRTVQNYENI